MGDKVQEVWDGMNFMKDDFGYGFVGGSSMYVGRECQYTGPSENQQACIEKIHEYLLEKYNDHQYGLVDYWVKPGSFGDLWDLEKELRRCNKEYGKEYIKMKNATSLQKKMMNPLV